MISLPSVLACPLPFLLGFCQENGLIAPQSTLPEMFGMGALLLEPLVFLLGAATLIGIALPNAEKVLPPAPASDADDSSEPEDDKHPYNCPPLPD